MQVAPAAYPLMNVLQDHKRPELSVACLAALLRLYCERLGLDPHEEVSRAHRVVQQGPGQHRPEFRAVRSLIDGEYRRKNP